LGAALAFVFFAAAFLFFATLSHPLSSQVFTRDLVRYRSYFFFLVLAFVFFFAAAFLFFATLSHPLSSKSSPATPSGGSHNNGI
jgi:cytochrome c oxidase assembly factor CtaG